MKRTLIVSAIAALAAGSALAQSSVTVYGRLNVTVENQKNIDSTSDKTLLVNNASRLGFKGTEDLGGGLKANFLLEHRFNVDTGTATGDFWAGDSWVGLSGGFGEVRLGRLTSAAYFATADYVSMHNHDTGTSEDKLYTYLGQNKNTIAYITPSFSGFTAEVQYSLGEGAGKERNRVLNLAGNYDAGPLHLGLGYEQIDDSTDDNQLGLRALYEFGAFTVGGYYQRSDIQGLGTRNAYRLSGMYTMGASEFHLNVGQADSWSDVSGTKATQWTLGYNYNLSKRTKVYAFYSSVDNGNVAYFGLDNKTTQTIAAGIRHNF